MKTLNYSVAIKAPKEAVWDAIVNLEKYKKWAKGFSPDSSFEGEWAPGAYIKFIDPNKGGTKAFLEEATPAERIRAKHVAVLDPKGAELEADDMAKKWIGSTETYVLHEARDVTELSIEIVTHEDFEKMFEDCWPKSLELLKAVAESS